MNPTKAFIIFSCKYIVAPISPTRIGELNSHHMQSPVRVEDMHNTGCCPVPRRDRLQHNLSAMQPSTRCLTPWLRWTRALFAVLGRHPPSATRTPRVNFFLGGGRVVAVCHRNLTSRRHVVANGICMSTPNFGCQKA
jgi:hypothetical protein